MQRTPDTAFDAALDRKRGWHSPLTFPKTDRQDRTSFWDHERETEFPSALDIVYNVQDFATISKSVAESPLLYRQRAPERPLPRYPETVTLQVNHHGFPPVGSYKPASPLSVCAASFSNSAPRSRSPVQCVGPDLQLFHGAPRPLTAGVADTGFSRSDTRGWTEGKDKSWPMPTGGSRTPGPDGAVRIMRQLTGPASEKPRRSSSRDTEPGPFDWILDKPGGAARVKQVLDRASCGDGDGNGKITTTRQLLRSRSKTTAISDPKASLADLWGAVTHSTATSRGTKPPGSKGRRIDRFSVTIRYGLAGKFLRFCDCGSDTVWALKNRVSAKTGAEPAEQTLYFDGKELHDDDAMLITIVHDGSVLSCMVDDFLPTTGSFEL